MIFLLACLAGQTPRSSKACGDIDLEHTRAIGTGDRPLSTRVPGNMVSEATERHIRMMHVQDFNDETWSVALNIKTQQLIRGIHTQDADGTVQVNLPTWAWEQQLVNILDYSGADDAWATPIREMNGDTTTAACGHLPRRSKTEPAAITCYIPAGQLFIVTQTIQRTGTQVSQRCREVHDLMMEQMIVVNYDHIY